VPESAAYDVIIAGASFAGLAAARQLRARVVVVDREPLGAGVTSACAAPVAVVEGTGAGGAIQQVHDRLVLHTPARSSSWALPEPFCTFDYERFCRLAAAGAGAEFRRTAILGRRGDVLQTADGDLSGRWLIDATGWRRVLGSPPRTGGSASSRGPAVSRPGRLAAFGIESEVPAEIEPGLHFYFLPEVRDGYAWAFPAGGGVRFGVLSYLGRTKLQSGLIRFMARFGRRPGSIHGGYLSTGFRDPVDGVVFVAGDAAGQCLPLTGEGIRTAILAGYRVGDLVQEVLDGRCSAADAAARYRRFVAEHRRAYRVLLWGNLALMAMPLRLTGAAAAYLSRPGPLGAFMRRYLGIFAGSPQAAGGRPAGR
jgi:flavin-dependent dehydrogenase